jgi:hypothetical protein
LGEGWVRAAVRRFDRNSIEHLRLLKAILTIFLGNLIVLIPMILNAHAGTR